MYDEKDIFYSVFVVQKLDVQKREKICVVGSILAKEHL